MKTNKFFVLATLMGAFVFTSCSVEDNAIPPLSPVKATISFENQALNSDGFWMGDTNGAEFDNWGSPAYACAYEENVAKFPVNFTPAWNSFSGFAVSSRTATTYNGATMVPDEFNNITGKAKTGNNFCVVYTFGEQITFNVDKGVTVKGLSYTNAAWTVDAILNGDGMTPGAFTAEDFLTCTITGTKADGTTATVDIDLAKNGNYVKEWQFADLSSLGKVVSLGFTFTGSKANDYGLTTPTFICIDDIEIEY